MISEVRGGAVVAVRDRRAGGTARSIVGPEHEMVNEELRAFTEQIHERRFSLIGLESVLLIDPYPRQLLPPPRQLIATPRQFLFLLEQLQPCRKPFSRCSSLMFSHRRSLFLKQYCIFSFPCAITWCHRPLALLRDPGGP